MSESIPNLTTICPRCRSLLRVKPTSLGKTIGCTRCDHRFVAQLNLGLDDESSGDYTAPPVAAPPDEERLEIFCPECAAGLSVRKVYVGQYVRCRKCNYKFVVRSPTAANPPPRLASSSGRGDFDTLELLARLSNQDDDRDELKRAHDALQAAHQELLTAHAELQAKLGEFAARQVAHEAERERLRDELGRATEDRDLLATELVQVKGELGLLWNGTVSRAEVRAAGSLVQDEAEHADPLATEFDARLI